MKTETIFNGQINDVKFSDRAAMDAYLKQLINEKQPIYIYVAEEKTVQTCDCCEKKEADKQADKQEKTEKSLADYEKELDVYVPVICEDIYDYLAPEFRDFDVKTAEGLDKVYKDTDAKLARRLKVIEKIEKNNGFRKDFIDKLEKRVNKRYNEVVMKLTDLTDTAKATKTVLVENLEDAMKTKEMPEVFNKQLEQYNLINKTRNVCELFRGYLAAIIDIMRDRLELQDGLKRIEVK